MSHMRLALGFPRHRKVKRISNDAFCLWVNAMHHARDQGTDGFLDDVELDDVPRCPKRGAKRKALVTELVTARLWDVSGDGWQIHDYTDWQDSAEQVKRKANAARASARAYREREAARKAARASNVIHDGIDDARGDISTSSSDSSAGSESGNPEGDARGSPPKDRFGKTFETLIPDVFDVTDVHRELCRTRDLDLENELAKHRIWANQHGRRCLDWSADFEFWLRNSRIVPPGKRRGGGSESPQDAALRAQVERAQTLAEQERQAGGTP